MTNGDYINAVVSASLDDEDGLSTLSKWLRKWEHSFEYCFEATRYRKRMYDILAPEKAINELPESFVLDRARKHAVNE